MKGIIKKIALAVIFGAVVAAVIWFRRENPKYDVIRGALIGAAIGALLVYFCYRFLSFSVARPKRTKGALEESTSEARQLYADRRLLQEEVSELRAKLSTLKAKLEAEISNRPSDQSNLQEQLKHLNCLHGLSKLVALPEISLDQIFQETTELLRNAYRYPDMTCVRITFNGIRYKTDNFQKTEESQRVWINVRGTEAGAIEVYYIGEKVQAAESAFVEKEHDLLVAVAQHLGRIAEGQEATERLGLFRRLIDGSNDSIFVIEPKWGRFLDVNRRACDSLAYAREELLDMTVKDIDESIQDDSSWQQQAEELRLKEDIVNQNLHRRSDGTTFVVETSLKLVKQEKEDYIIAIARDITERKQAEDRQVKLLAELESANQELKDFAYVVSHDLKAPLRGIKTLADWLSNDYAEKLGKDGKEQVNLLSTRAQLMHKLVDGILQYSTAGRVEKEKDLVDLNKLIAEVIDVLAPPENITITVENELPLIEFERTSITQVFQNLLSNAVKYMDKPLGQIRIGCVEENGFWKFTVADNGLGIEEKHFGKIFKLFQTLSPRDDGLNTGIGLSLAKKIVESNGGTIWVESTLGQGTTFFFRFPKSQKEVAGARLEVNTVS